MKNDLFISKETLNKAKKEVFSPATKNNGCVSSAVVAVVFGILVGFTVHALGYPMTTAVFSGIATLLLIMILHLALTFLYLGFLGLIGLLSVGMAIFFSLRKRK